MYKNSLNLKRVTYDICRCSFQNYHRVALLGLCWDSRSAECLSLGWHRGHQSWCSSLRVWMITWLHMDLFHLVCVQMQVWRAACRLWGAAAPSFLILLSVLWQGDEGLMSQMELRQTGFDVSDLCISHLCRLMQNLGYWSQRGNPDLAAVWASVSGTFVLHFLTARMFSAGNRWRETVYDVKDL